MYSYLGCTSFAEFSYVTSLYIFTEFFSINILYILSFSSFIFYMKITAEDFDVKLIFVIQVFSHNTSKTNHLICASLKRIMLRCLFWDESDAIIKIFITN